MAFTGRLGTDDSQPGNIELGSDSGSPSDLDLDASDTGEGSDDATLNHSRQTSDSGAGLDSASLGNPGPADAAVGTDSAFVTKFGGPAADFVATQQAACGPYSGPVTILYDGIDITSCVMIEDAQFNSKANGQVGSCTFRVKDRDHAFDFVTGRTIELTIDGTRQWSGFVGRVRRGFFFVGSDDDPGEVVRYFEITGFDLNILFRRRVLFDKVTPTNMQLSPFPVDTDDDVVIKHYIANHLDLSGDGLSDAGIEHVGTPSQDDEISGAAGWTWDDFLRYARFNTGALDYIDPDRVVIHTDVDQPNAPYILTDQVVLDGDVEDPNYVRYREVLIDNDGSALRNDVMVWGFGQGSILPVFRREIDGDSIAQHGIWQEARVMAMVWRQETVDRAADSLVNGSPQSQRGGKDDAVAIQLIVFRPGFRVGQKAEVVSSVWSFDQVFPIRSMEIDFPAKHPRYQLVLSHEIDDPWSSIDPIRFPDFPPLDFPIIKLPPFPTVPFQVIDSFDNRDDSTIFADGPPGPDEGWWYASDYPSFLWTSNEAGVQRVYGGYGRLLQGGNDNPTVGNTLTDYLVYPDFGPVWIGLWRFAAPHGDANANMEISGNFATIIKPTYVMHDSVLTVAEYFMMVQVSEEGGDLRLQAKIWTIWEDEPVSWDTDTLTSLFSMPLSINVNFVDFDHGAGLVRVDWVWQLSEPSLPVAAVEAPAPQAGHAQGQICELPVTRSAPPGYPGGDSYFGMRSAFVPGTTRLWVGGALLRRGVDYDEGDPYYGPFLHVPDTIDVAGKTVYVCYEASLGGS